MADDGKELSDAEVAERIGAPAAPVAEEKTTEEVVEELMAWMYGEQLAEKLKIKIDKNKYHRIMVKYVFSYIEAAVD